MGFLSPQDSRGFPNRPAWGWNKASPKKSLSDIGMAITASQLYLNITELVHWTPIIPAFLMAASIFHHKTQWTNYLDGDETRALILLLSPVISFFGGLPGIMMHTYEGWQVAPFENPLGGNNVVITDKNNQWLRIVAYFFIFNMQYLGLQTFSYAILGPSAFAGLHKFLSIMGFLTGYLGNQNYKATFYFKWKGTTGGSTFPIAWMTVIPFIMAATVNMYTFTQVGQIAFEGPFSIVRSINPPLLIALGGVIEGIFAETVFDQKIHIFAVVLFNLGFWLQLDLLEKAGSNFRILGF